MKQDKLKIVGIIAVLSTAIIACKKPKGLEYVSTTGWKVEQEGLLNTTIHAEVRYYNPNRYPLQMKKANCDVFVNETFMGHFDLDSLLTLPAKDTFMIPVKMKTETVKLLKAGVAFLDKEVKVRVNGNVKVGRSGVFLNVPLSYEGIQKIEL